MKIYGIGTDIIRVSRIKNSLKKKSIKSRLFNKKLGGGSILDLGCYPLSFLNLLSYY